MPFDKCIDVRLYAYECMPVSACVLANLDDASQGSIESAVLIVMTGLLKSCSVNMKQHLQK